MTRVEELPKFVQIIAIVALMAGVFVVILSEFQDEQETTTAVVNETVTFTANDTYYYLYNNATSNSTTYWVELVNSSVDVQNSTYGAVLRAGNWTVDINLGRIAQISDGEIQTGSSQNVSYSYVTGTVAWANYDSGIDGILETTGWLDLVALIIMAGIILGIVLRQFGGRGERGY